MNNRYNSLIGPTLADISGIMLMTMLVMQADTAEKRNWHSCHYNPHVLTLPHLHISTPLLGLTDSMPLMAPLAVMSAAFTHLLPKTINRMISCCFPEIAGNTFNAACHGVAFAIHCYGWQTLFQNDDYPVDLSTIVGPSLILILPAAAALTGTSWLIQKAAHRCSNAFRNEPVLQRIEMVAQGIELDP